MDECLALADLGASINLMPLSVWEGLSLPKLTLTCMTLEITDRSVSKPIGIAKYVLVKVGVFHFPVDFVVVDFEPDPRVPLIHKRCFLKIEVELKDLPPHLEYAFLEGDNKLPVIIAKELGDEHKSTLIKVLKSHKRAIAWKLSDIQATRKDHFPLPFMDQMLERLAGNEYYCFLDGFSGYFQIPIDPRNQEKTTFTAHMARLPSTYALWFLQCTGHVSKVIEVDKAKVDVIAKLPHPTTVKESNYTMTEKEMLAVVFAFEKFRSYLIMNKSIVHTDHSALKYLFSKKDAKARLLWWVLLLQESNFKVLDIKGAKNLAANHLSRLENPYENVLDPKEINET
nr:DNA-directed DNA polymerase [Tanacetum cinerariifolium]